MKIAVIKGDGIGPEVINESLKVLKIIKEKFSILCEIDEFPFGADYFLKTGISIPENVFKEWPEKYNAILFGAIGDPKVKSHQYAKEILLGLRFKLDLYVNYRPIFMMNKDYCPLKNINDGDINFAVFRENTEDLYTESGGNFKKNTEDEIAVENSIHTRLGVRRIIKHAFEYAKKNDLSEVLMSDKSNAMKYAGDLWQRTFYEVGEEYPQIKKRHLYIDALHMKVVRNPKEFQVIVTSNVFGDILTDLCAELQGGLGLSTSANLNPENKLLKGLYEPIHGSAYDIAGKNIANPMAAILTLSMLLEDQGYSDISKTIKESVRISLDEKYVTPDLGGSYSTVEVGNHICDLIQKSISEVGK